MAADVVSRAFARFVDPAPKPRFGSRRSVGAPPSPRYPPDTVAAFRADIGRRLRITGQAARWSSWYLDQRKRDTDQMPPTRSRLPRELGTVETRPRAIRARWPWPTMPSTALGLVIALAAVAVAGEAVLAVLLWKTHPQDPLGGGMAALMVVALLTNLAPASPRRVRSRPNDVARPTWQPSWLG